MSKEFIVHLREDRDWKYAKDYYAYKAATVILKRINKTQTSIQYSLCHRGDSFCKKIGVAKAREKAIKIVDNKDIAEQLKTIREYLERNKYVLEYRKPGYNDYLLAFKFLTHRDI